MRRHNSISKIQTKAQDSHLTLDAFRKPDLSPKYQSQKTKLAD